MARDAVKLVLIRRDRRRTRQFRNSQFQTESRKKPECFRNEAATYCLIVKAASSIFAMFVDRGAGNERYQHQINTCL